MILYIPPLRGYDVPVFCTGPFADRKGGCVSMKRSPSGRLFIVAAALLWGLGGVCIKSVSWNTMAITFSRSVLALPVLLLVRRGKPLRLTRTDLLGALAMTVTGLVYIQAVKWTTAGTAIVLQYIAPVLIFLYSVIFKGRRATKTEVIITAVVFAGVLLCFSDSFDLTRVLGNALALFSGVTFAAQIVIMSDREADSGNSLILACIMAALISLPFVLFGPRLSFDRKNIFWILIMGLFQYGAANACFGIGVKTTDPVESGLLLTLEPVCNPILVALICGEVMGPRALAGAAIVVAALVIRTLLQKRNEPEPEP